MVSIGQFRAGRRLATSQASKPLKDHRAASGSAAAISPATQGITAGLLSDAMMWSAMVRIVPAKSRAKACVLCAISAAGRTT
jgi:hypothetical protein